MRRLIPFLQLNNIKPSSIYQFPFDNLHTFAWGEKAFRIFVDANNNSGIQNGKSWQTAFTSIQQALDFLPDDLLFFNAFILVAGGNYSLPSIVSKKNGIIFFEYIGDTWNNFNDSDFQTLGRTFSPSPALLQQSSAQSLSGRNLEIHFRSRSPQWLFVYNGWRLKIMPASNAQYLFTVYGELFLLITNMVLDASDSTYSNFKSLFRFMNPASSHHGLQIDTFSIIGRGNDSTDELSASLVGFHDNSALIRCNIGSTYFPGWASGKTSPNSKRFVFNNVKKFFTISNIVPNATLPQMNIDLTSVDFTQGSTGQSKIKMSVCQYHSGGKLIIDDSLVELTDNSGKISELTKTNSGVVISYIGNGFKHNSNFPILSTNNSAPSDSILSNKDVSFWIDELNHKLKIKLKYNDGTVKSGEISLV